MNVVFWVCVVGSVYSYLIYPLLLILVPRRPHHHTPREPAADGRRVSLIIACRNEAGRLRQKIENALESDHAGLEILVASDASDDGSDDIVREYSSRGVRLVRSPVRLGKEHAQGLAIQESQGDLLVFSDAGTDIPPRSISRLVELFDDPGIGAISSEDTFLAADGRIAGEGAYVRYEMWLRLLESQRAGLVGLSGSFFAIRREVADAWDVSIPSDFACALNAVRKGLVSVSTSEVRGIYRDIKDPKREFGRKVRTGIRGMSAVFRVAEVLNPLRYGWFSFQVWSHKVMRWAVPWFLLGVVVATLVLAADHRGFRVLLLLETAGILVLLGIHWQPGLRGITVLRIAYYFAQTNLALAVAATKFMAGRRVTVWEPSVR